MKTRFFHKNLTLLFPCVIFQNLLFRNFHLNQIYLTTRIFKFFVKFICLIRSSFTFYVIFVYCLCKRGNIALRVSASFVVIFLFLISTFNLQFSTTFFGHVPDFIVIGTHEVAWLLLQVAGVRAR